MTVIRSHAMESRCDPTWTGVVRFDTQDPRSGHADDALATRPADYPQAYQLVPVPARLCVYRRSRPDASGRDPEAVHRWACPSSKEQYEIIP